MIQKNKILFLFSILLSFSAFSAGVSNSGPIDERYYVTSLPSTGTFITVQIAVISSGNFRHDNNLMTTNRVVDYMYVRESEELEYYSIGLFNSLEAAQKFQQKILCVHPTCFRVAYQNGERIPIDQFSQGNGMERVSDLNAALPILDKMIHTGYYRIQIGYYEKPGYSFSEKKKYKKLEKNEIKVIEEPYEYGNGRLILTEEKYYTYREAQAARVRINEIIGDYTALMSYEKSDEIYDWFVTEFYECILEQK